MRSCRDTRSELVTAIASQSLARPSSLATRISGIRPRMMASTSVLLTMLVSPTQIRIRDESRISEKSRFMGEPEVVKVEVHSPDRAS